MKEEDQGTESRGFGLDMALVPHHVNRGRIYADFADFVRVKMEGKPHELMMTLTSP